MKKSIIATLAALAALTASASAPADTVYQFTRPDTVRIVESASGVTVTIGEAGSSAVIESPFDEGRLNRSHRGFTFGKTRTGHFEVFMQGPMFGFVGTPGAPDGMGVEMGKSFEIGVLDLLGFKYHRHAWEVSLGFGIDWRNYRATRGTVFTADNGRVGLSLFPQDVTPRFSRLKIFSLQFPILYGLRLGRAAGHAAWLHLGPVLCLNTHGSAKTSWREPGEDRTSTVTSNSIGQRKFTVDFIGTLSLGSIGVYLRYSPYKVLTSAGAPEFRSLSTGLTLGF